jgi:hypothetical protein
MLLLSLLTWGFILWYGINHPIRGVPRYLCGGCFGDDDTTQSTTSEQKINYTPEATTAQTNWAKFLQDAYSSGDYGATDMNWDEIYDSAQNKVNQYYWGGVGTTGLAGKVKASAARRNASQSPAVENQLSLMGMQESQDLSDLFTNLNTQKAAYTESARNSWLSSLMNLAGMKSGVTGTSTTTTSQEDDSLSSILGTLTSSGLSLLTGGGSSFLTNLLKGTSQSSLLSGLGSAGSSLNLGSTGLSGFDWNN